MNLTKILWKFNRVQIEGEWYQNYFPGSCLLQSWPSLLRELSTTINCKGQKPQSDWLQEKKTMYGITEESREGSGYVRDSCDVVRSWSLSPFQLSLLPRWSHPQVRTAVPRDSRLTSSQVKDSRKQTPLLVLPSQVLWYPLNRPTWIWVSPGPGTMTRGAWVPDHGQLCFPGSPLGVKNTAPFNGGGAVSSKEMQDTISRRKENAFLSAKSNHLF